MWAVSTLLPRPEYITMEADNLRQVGPAMRRLVSPRISGTKATAGPFQGPETLGVTASGESWSDRGYVIFHFERT